MRKLSALIDILNKILDIIEENECTWEEIDELLSVLKGDADELAKRNHITARLKRIQTKLDLKKDEEI